MLPAFCCCVFTSSPGVCYAALLPCSARGCAMQRQGLWWWRRCLVCCSEGWNRAPVPPAAGSSLGQGWELHGWGCLCMPGPGPPSALLARGILAGLPASRSPLDGEQQALLLGTSLPCCLSVTSLPTLLREK